MAAGRRNFFLQAEDGIRDGRVTGVQTCALPISASGPYAELHVADKTYAVRERMQTLEEQLDPSVFFRIHRSAIVRLDRRSEERRVGNGSRTSTTSRR